MGFFDIIGNALGGKKEKSTLASKSFKCPNCGADVEIFSDETRVKCQKCGQKVYKERLPSCIEWCAKARECLGEERWRQLKGEDEDSLSPNKEVENVKT